jgi:hypothetical protein
MRQAATSAAALRKMRVELGSDADGVAVRTLLSPGNVTCAIVTVTGVWHVCS